MVARAKNRVFRLGMALTVATALRAEIAVGDSYQKVIDQKGPAAGKMQAGEMMILRYPEQTIRLKAGKVVAIEAVKPSDTATPRDEPAARPAPRARSDEDESAPGPAVELPWTEDYGAAVATAKAQNRRVLIYFTGSDWSPWCIRMDREIFSTAEFAAYAQDNLVLVQIDFPRKKPVTPRQKWENMKLEKFYGVKGYPSVIVLDSAGQLIARLAYAEGGPKAFIQRLSSL